MADRHLAKLRAPAAHFDELAWRIGGRRLATRAVRLDAGTVVADTCNGATFQSVFSFAGG